MYGDIYLSREPLQMGALGRTLALALLITIILTPGSRCSYVEEKQRTQQHAFLLTEVNTTESVLMGARALLCCPRIPSRKVIVITWKVNPRGQPSCSIAYDVDTKTNNTTCTDRRITWASTPDQSPHLQISPVDITHDGYYTCEMAGYDGNFQRSYALQVLVPPVVTLISWADGTTVCEAVAGKPAAQIHWTPEGDCVTETESPSNDIVTVRSTCSWVQNNVPAVSCFISHLTGNQTLFIQINQGIRTLIFTTSSLLIVLYVKLSLFVIALVIVGFAFSQKTNYFRK